MSLTDEVPDEPVIGLFPFLSALDGVFSYERG